MRRPSTGVAVVLATAVALAIGVSAGSAGGPATDGARVAQVDTGSALVLLKGEPLATYEKTRPPKGKKIDFSSNQVKSYRAQLNQLRNEFKQWLRLNAKDANVTGEFDIALNAVSVRLNGVPLSKLSSAPMVQRAEYEGLYTPAAHGFDPDLSLIDAFDAWGGEGGAATAGAGIKVAIIDTGIDTRHPCFGSGSTNGGTNAKVRDAAVYYNKNNQTNFTPADANGHGSHVAGTVACNFNTPAVVNGVAIPYGVSGVAPAAQLGNFNVFPGDVENARSEDILNALEDALEKGYDVANMSLGGGSHGIQDLLSIGVDNADKAGMVVAVAAGNSGPGLNTVESPGIAPRALTAGASTVGHFVGAEITRGAVTAGAAAGDFETVDADLTRPVSAPAGPGVAGLSQGCAPFAAGSMTGTIALIARGTCTFETKIRNAGTAGADAVVVVNNVAGDPIAMGDDTAIPGLPTTPAYMVSTADGAALVGAVGNATIEAAQTYFLTGNDDFMAGFSSQGPTDVDFRVKPDVVAPGVNVLSAQPDNGWAFFQGTSMATPHLAGSSAFLKSKFPNWSSDQIRSAIVNTAEEGVLKTFNTGVLTANVNVVGSGRLNLDNAEEAKVALDPVSVSFGGVPSGAGRSDTRTVSLSNLGGSGPYTATVTGENCAPLVDFGASVSGTTVTVTMMAQKLQGATLCQGILRIFNAGGEVAHATVFALIK